MAGPVLRCKTSLDQLIRSRYSCRSFDGQGLAGRELNQLYDFLSQIELPFHSQIRWGIIDKKKVFSENFFSTGTYGMIKGTRFFLTGMVRKEIERKWEDLGYGLEAAVLYATGTGIQTCWIGGVFDRLRFGRQLNIRDDELLPAVIAVGRASDRRTLRDRLVHWGARGGQRKSVDLLFFRDDFSRPLGLSQLSDIGRLLENVRLAPSASNKQPWRIVVQDHFFHFFLDRDRAYAKLISSADLQRIDMGIAMCHFELSTQNQGINGEWVIAGPDIAGTPGHYEYIVSFKKV